MPRDLELAAPNLGASRWDACCGGSPLPLISANLIAGGLLAFAFAMLEVSDSLMLAQKAAVLSDHPGDPGIVPAMGDGQLYRQRVGRLGDGAAGDDHPDCRQPAGAGGWGRFSAVAIAAAALVEDPCEYNSCPRPRSLMANKGMWAAVLLACVGLCACGESPEPLTAGDFVTTVRRTINGRPLSPGRPGGIGAGAAAAHGTPPEEDEPPTPGISQAVQEVVRPVGGGRRGAPATLPRSLPGRGWRAVAATAFDLATTVPSFPSDQYVELGSVVAVVDGKPIFANKILRLDAPLYREYAQQMDMQHYEVAVRAELSAMRDELIYDELEVAAALKSLDDKDKQMADALTARWRVQQIDEAGGSLGVARQKALAQGKTFEEAVEDHHRWLLQQIYYEKKISPRIQVSRVDMVKFYKDHQDDRAGASPATTAPRFSGSSWTRAERRRRSGAWAGNGH